MRTLYEDIDSPCKTLKPKDATEPLAEGLEAALAPLHSHHKSYAAINQWLQHAEAIGDLSMVVLCQHLLKHPPTPNINALQFNVEALKFIGRHQLNVAHARVFEIMKPHFNWVPNASLHQALQQGLTP